MITHPSPLRYPGGKTRLYPFLEAVLRRARLLDCHYIEPYAGGAGAGLALLFREAVSSIQINDASPAIAAFWRAVVSDTERLCDTIASVPLTVDEWHSQHTRIRDATAKDFELGFAAFYLNRTNRSGIIKSGGVIGGLEQAGRWKMDARFNRNELIRRIRRIALYRDRITVTALDALDVLRGLADCGDYFVYADPPYYHQAERLYDQWYGHDDHVIVAEAVQALSCSWVVSYDDCSEIRAMYTRHHSLKLHLQYSAARSYSGAEVVFLSEDLAKRGVTSQVAG